MIIGLDMDNSDRKNLIDNFIHITKNKSISSLIKAFGKLPSKNPYQNK